MMSESVLKLVGNCQDPQAKEGVEELRTDFEYDVEPILWYTRVFS